MSRIVATPAVAAPLLDGLVEGARRLRVGDPLDPQTEIGPLPSREALAAAEAALAEAERAGAERLCGGPLEVPGVPGAFMAPTVLRAGRGATTHAAGGAMTTGATPAPAAAAGPIVLVVEAADEAAAVAIARGSATVSVWTDDRGRGERVARALGAEVAWVNEHGHAPTAAPVRIGRHVVQRQLASQPARLRSARRLPYDPSFVRARTALARLAHGRQSERVAALREGAAPLARTAFRVAREAARR